MSEFLPSYARKNSQVLKKSENRWTRLSEKENKLSVEEEITAKLYRTVVAILNKLAPQNFKTLIEKIMELRIDTPERLEGVVERIFEKAIREPMYSAVYANMCRCLLQIKVSGPDDNDVTFLKCLCKRCQKEFEKAPVEQETQLEGLSEDEKKMKREEMKEEASKNKRRMLGNIKFIGELFKLKLLTDKIMHDCIFNLLRAGDEESLESMCTLLFTIGKVLDSDRAKPRMEQYFDYINKIISGKKTSLKVSFMLRDVVDLRKNNWVPRHEEIYNPKTIDQIHKEAHEMQRLQKKGERRDSPKLMQLSNDGWMVSRRVGKPLSIDTNKLKNISKRANADDKISLGPSGRSLEPSRRSLGGLSQSGRGSTGGLGKSGSTSNEQEVPANRSSAGARTGGKRQSTSNVKGKADTTMIKGIKDKIRPSLTTEEMTKKTKAIIDMFVNIEDMGAALSCFTYFKSPEIHHVFVSTAVEHTYEFDSTARQLTGRLFNELLLQRKLAKEQFSLGLGKALKFAEDSATNYPKLWCYLAEIITPVIVGNQFKLADLKPLILHLVECKKAGVVLAQILTIIAKESSPANAKLFWTNSNISCLDVLAKDMPHREFLQQKNLTFLPSDIDEINKLLHQEVIVNDTVNACIDRATAVEDMNSLEPLSAFSPGVCGTTGGWGNSGSAFHDQKVVASRSSAGARTGDKGQVRSDCHSAVEALKFSTKPQMKSEVVQSTYNVQEKVETTMTKGIKHKIRPPLTTKEMTKKMKAIIDMFVNIEDIEEALSCFTDLKSPEIHHVFVFIAVEHTYEFDSKARQLTGRLFNELLFRRKLAKEQFSLGLKNALEFAENSVIDYPKLWCYLAEIITPVIVGEQFLLADLKPLIMHLVQCNKAAVLLTEILTIIGKEKGPDEAKLLWTASDISWSDVLAEDILTHEFLQQKSLTFLRSEIDELIELLRDELVANNNVFAFIEKHFKEETRKEPEFLSQLASAVAKSCLINKDEKDGPDCCAKRLKARKNILHKYLDKNHGLELEILFALQTLYVQHNKPGRMILTFFNVFYDEEVITEDSFFTWRNDNNPSRQEGKGQALAATTSFFEWLQSAAEESHES